MVPAGPRATFAHLAPLLVEELARAERELAGRRDASAGERRVREEAAFPEEEERLRRAGFLLGVLAEDVGASLCGDRHEPRALRSLTALCARLARRRGVRLDRRGPVPAAVPGPEGRRALRAAAAALVGAVGETAPGARLELRYAAEGRPELTAVGESGAGVESGGEEGLP